MSHEDSCGRRIAGALEQLLLNRQLLLCIERTASERSSVIVYMRPSSLVLPPGPCPCTHREVFKRPSLLSCSAPGTDTWQHLSPQARTYNTTACYLHQHKTPVPPPLSHPHIPIQLSHRHLLFVHITVQSPAPSPANMLFRTAITHSPCSWVSTKRGPVLALCGCSACGHSHAHVLTLEVLVVTPAVTHFKRARQVAGLAGAEYPMRAECGASCLNSHAMHSQRSSKATVHLCPAVRPCWNEGFAP